MTGDENEKGWPAPSTIFGGPGCPGCGLGMAKIGAARGLKAGRSAGKTATPLWGERVGKDA